MACISKHKTRVLAGFLLLVLTIGWAGLPAYAFDMSFEYEGVIIHVSVTSDSITLTLDAPDTCLGGEWYVWSTKGGSITQPVAIRNYLRPDCWICQGHGGSNYNTRIVVPSTPDTTWYVRIDGSFCGPSYGGIFGWGGWNGVAIATLANVPTGLSFPVIEQNRIQLAWNTNGNPDDTSYTVQRRTDTSPWFDVATIIGGNQYADSGLQASTKYYYRIRVNQKIGWPAYSSESWIKTSADPAVAAAQAAQSAAESSKAFAEDAKIAAQSAQVSAQNAEGYLDGSKNGGKSLAAVYDKIKETQDAIKNNAAQIQQVRGYGGATCTQTNDFKMVIRASGATEWRVKADTGDWSDWIPVNMPATATGINGSGVHEIAVEARNSTGAIITGQVTVFRI